MNSDINEAYVLHYQQSGSKLKLILLTPSMGRITCYFRQGQKSTNRVFIQPFLPYWINLSIKAYGNYVQNIEPQAVSHLWQDNRLYAGLYLNELLYRVLPEEEACPLLYESYVKTLNKIEQGDIEPALRLFEYQLLCYSGYGFSFDVDVQGAPIDARLHYEFFYGHGFKPDTKGYLGADLLTLAASDLGDVSTSQISKHIMRRAINGLLDNKPLFVRTLIAKKIPAKSRDQVEEPVLFTAGKSAEDI